MRPSSSALALLALLCMSGSASAQGADEGTNPQACRDAGLSREACFFAELGRCANPNPRIAIPACSRQLTQPDDRNFPAKLRTTRALRYAARGLAYAKQGNIDRTLADFDLAIRADDKFYWIHAFKASALFAIGEEEEALAAINDAVVLAPDNAELLNARARLLSTALNENVRDGTMAIADAQRALALTPGRPAYIAALATAYAENGEFENAVETQQFAIDQLEDQLNPADPAYRDTIDSYQSRLALYRERMPFRREMITCGTDEDRPDTNRAADDSVFSPLVFCYRDAT